MLKVYSDKRHSFISFFIMFSLIFGLFGAGSVPAHAAGTIYYISYSAGNDNNNGTSPSTPWKTLAKASGITYQPGDQILLKCGDTWTEQFTLSGSGTSTSPITISSFGTGNKPKILRSDKNVDKCIYGPNVAGWKITNLELNTGNRGIEFYYTTYDNRYIWIENCDFYNFDSGVGAQVHANLSDTNRTALYDLTVKGCYATRCYIGFSNGGNESFNNFKNINISDCFFEDINCAGLQLNHCTGAKISHVSILRSGKAVVPTGTIGALEGFCKDVVYEDCEFSETERNQVNDGGGFDHECGDDLVTFKHCLFHENAAYGVMMYDNGRDASNRNLRYEDSVFYLNNANSPFNCGEIHFMAGTYNSGVFEGNRIYTRAGYPAFAVSGTGTMAYSHFIDNIQTSTSESNGTNLAISAVASASSQYDSNFTADKAKDNNAGTIWKSAPGTAAGQWLQLDFGTVQNINKLIVDEDSSSSINRFKVQYWDSVDSRWYDCFNGTGIGTAKQMPIPEIATSKVRLLVRSTVSGVPAIKEFGAYKVNYAQPAQSSGHLDDFNRSTLDSGWSWVREDNTNWNLTEKSGKLRINCQEGDLQGTTNNAKNILVRSPGSTNFAVTTRVEFRANVDNQQAGIIIYDNDDNYIKLVKTYKTDTSYSFSKNSYYIQGATEVNGVYTTNEVLYYPPIASLKVVKSGKDYTLYYKKEESDSWNKLVTYYNINFSSSVKVGLISYGAQTPVVNADFDWFDIIPLGQQSPYGGANWTLPGIIEAENYDFGGADVAFHDGEVGNLLGQYRTGPGEDVDIEACSDLGLGYDVGCINNTAEQEWLEYTVDIPSGNYNIVGRFAAVANGSMRVYLDGTLLGTIGIPNTGGWQNWQSASLSNVSVTGGNGKELRVEFLSQCNFNWIKFEPNIALGKPATASSLELQTFPASYATDGNTTTRWSSLYSDPQWIYVDLGSVYSIDTVRLNWEAAFGKAYKVQVSTTGTNDSDFTDVYSTASGDGGIDDITFNTASARYVRIYGTQRGTTWGYSLWEFGVYGLPANSVKDWDFANDTQGWTALNQISGFGWQSGGYIGGSVTGTDPSILSGSNLNLNITDFKKIHIRIKNGTSCTNGRFYFITNTDTTWNEAKAKSVVITPNDPNYSEYVVDMSTVANWTGTLKQLRFDPENSTSVGGTFSIDYIRIMNQ